MAKKEIKVRRGMIILLWMVALFSGACFTSCDESIIDEFTKTESAKQGKEIRPDTVTPEPQPDPMEYFIIPHHEVDGNVVTITDTIGEKTTDTKWVQTGKAVFTLKEYRYSTELKFKELDLALSNSTRTMEELEEVDDNGDVKHITHCSFAMADGNIGYVEAENMQLIREIDGQKHEFAHARLASFEVVSLANKPYTRGETYVVDSCDTEPVIKLHYVYENTDLPAVDVLVNQLDHRKFVANDDVDHWGFDNVIRNVLTETTEQGDFRKIAYKKSGEVEYLKKSTVFYYEIKPIGERNQQTRGTEYSLFSTGGVTYGDLTSNRTEGPWSYLRRPFNYGSVFTTPQGDVVETKYTGFTEEAVYDDGDIRVVFPVRDIDVSEGSTTVPLKDTSDLYEVYEFNNSVVANYQGYTQTASEKVTLLKQKEAPVVTEEYWDEASVKKIHTLWNTMTQIDYVIVKNGTEQRTTYVSNWGWDLVPRSGWAVHSSTTDFTVSAPIATISSENVKFTAEDGLAVWSAVRNSHDITSNVYVGNSVETDEWYAVTYNDISISRNGNVHSFGHDDYVMTDEGAMLGTVVNKDDADVYPYSRGLTFGIGDATTTVSVVGKITVPKTDTPTFFGLLEGIDCIVVNNPDHDDYWYALLAHEKGGRVIPGVWDKKGEVKWFLEDAQQVTASNLNGCAYEHKSGKWIPVHAWDSPDLLQYDAEDGSNADNQSYVTALNWNWDEGNTINGHPSVNTFRIFVSKIDGTVYLTDTYKGADLGSWTYKQ